MTTIERRQVNEQCKHFFPWESRCWAIAIVGVGFLLRIYRLGAESIWYDEGVSLFLAQQTPVDLIRHTTGDIHPPLYYLLLHFWIRLAGASEFAAAFLSLGFGLLVVAGIYFVGSRLCGRSVGTIAALLSAVAPFQIWYSQEIRMYSLGALLGLLAFWGAAGLLQARATTSRTVLWSLAGCYVIAGVLGLYAIYYFAFLLVALNVWAGIHLARDWRLEPGRARSRTIGWLGAQCAVLVLYAPWLGVAVRQALDPPVPPWRSAVSLWAVVTDSWSALAFGQSLIPTQVGAALVFAATLYVLGAIFAIRRDASLGLGLVLTTLLPVALIALASLWTPLFHVRYVFIYSPALYLVLATGILWLGKRLRVIGALVLVVWLAISGYSLYEYHVQPRNRSDDFRGAVQEIAERIRPGDAVLINAGYAYPPFVYYFPDEIAWRGRLVDYDPATQPVTGTVVLETGSIGGAESLGWGSADSDFYATTEASTAQALQTVFAVHPRVWVLRAYDTVVDPDGFVRGWLDAHGRLFEDDVFGGESYVRVQGYWTRHTAAHQAPQLSANVGLVFANQLELLGVVGRLDSVRAGSALEFDLYWQARRRMPDNYGVMLELVDGDARIWARASEPLGGSAYATSAWLASEVVRQPVRLAVPQGVPAGTYTLLVTVFDLRRNDALPVTDGVYEGTETEPWLGTVQVESSG